MQNVIDWLFEHLDSAVTIVMKSDMVHMNMTVTIDDIIVGEESVTIWYGDNFLKICSPVDTCIQEYELAVTCCQGLKLVFMDSDEI